MPFQNDLQTKNKNPISIHKKESNFFCISGLFGSYLPNKPVIQKKIKDTVCVINHKLCLKFMKQLCGIKIDILYKTITETIKILITELTKKRESERRTK